jgi:hypothetical protein
VEYGIVLILDIVVQPIKIDVEYVGVIMYIQISLLIIDCGGVSIMPAYSRTRRVTHLKHDVAMVVMRFNDVETEDCLESRMGSRRSRRASECCGR